jgi:hypothetical protein
MPDLCDKLRRQIFEPLELIPAGIRDWHAQHVRVDAVLVLHLE